MLQDLAKWLLDLSDSANSFSRITSNPSEGDFELWFLANGGHINSTVEIASNLSEGSFLRVHGDQDLLPGSTIISCPHHLALSWPSAHKYHLTHIRSAFRPHVATRLFLMKQYLLKERSPWCPYIKSIPQPYQKDRLNTPLYYSSDDLLWISGTNLKHARKVRLDAWRKEYDDAMGELLKDQTDGDQSELWTWELYLWTATVMSSRSFGVPAVFNQSEGDFPIHENVDGRSPVLIPGLDLLNHNPSQRVAWLWDSSSCIIKNDVKIVGGSQVWNNYGPKSNAELIMGYGFSLPENPADHFSISFSQAISDYIRATKSRRIALGSSPECAKGSGNAFRSEHTNIKNGLSMESVDILETEGPAEQDIHWVRTLDNGYEFSPSFLEDFSIAVENHRERLKADNGPLLNGKFLDTPFLDTPLSRKKLHVICAVVMILQKAQTTIRKHDKYLPEEPQNARQLDAARYRQGQLRVLEHVLGSLYGSLKSYVDINGSDNARSIRVIRLEHTMTASPKRLLKDFRTVLNAGMRTRDPSKIRERGGTDFAFTVWLCGLWVYAQIDNKTYEDDTASDADLEPHFLQWLQFLYETHPEDTTKPQSPRTLRADTHKIEENEWFDPVRNQDIGEDLSSVAASYLDAVHAAVAKHPQSLYNDPKITAQRLAWYLNIVRTEGVWYPNLQESEQEEDDEWVLFLDCGST